jgi:ribosomal protein S18 acetylase RimI-like enzyme
MTELEENYLNAIGFKLLTPAKSYRNQHFYEKLGYVKTSESAAIPNNEFRAFKYVKKRNPIKRQGG